MQLTSDKILGAPKAELHVHLEGTITPDMMLKLAARNGVKLPFATAEEIEASYNFENLAGFIAIFYAGLQVLCTEDDFFDVTYDYLRRAHDENIVYAEIYFSPQSHLERGLTFASVMDGILKAMDKAKAELGIEAHPILGLQRHREEAAGLAVIEEALPYRDRIIALGLGGVELGNPPEKFATAFERARQLGWRTTAHAGEEGPSDYVRQAIDVLHVDRIDHGVQSESDPELVKRIAASKIPLTICPISNLKLGVCTDLQHHGLRRLFHCGCMVSLNSDDPSYFQANLTENIQAAAEALVIPADEVREIIANGFRGAFCDDGQKEIYLAKHDRYWAEEVS